MASLQELNRRIKSVKSTRKITRAMQLVSSAKMRKSQLAALSGRKYAELAWQLIEDINNGQELDHPLLKSNFEAKKTAVIIISTNKGLVGAFNNNLFKKILKLSKEAELDVITVGRKASEAMPKLKQSLVSSFKKLDTTIPVKEIYPLAKFISDEYASNKYKQVYLVYNKFVSMISQEASVQTLLPLIRPEHSNHKAGEVIFEPNINEVLNNLLPRIIESQIYQAILESDASEHSARMMMMKNATDNAADLIDDLTLTFNQLRQNKITTELSEITAGKIALE